MNPSLPPTLQGAILFSYLNAAFALLALIGGASPVALVILAGGFGAYGIANERKWGYQLCLVVGIVYLVLQLLIFLFAAFVFSELLNLLFSVVLVAFLLHPMSRSYQRIHFR
jgi:hypothetical protein